MAHMHTFIVTNVDMETYQILQFYCSRGKMENFIREGKNGLIVVNSHFKVVNANWMWLHMFVYSLFNWLRFVLLSANMRKQQIDAIRFERMSNVICS